MKNVVLMLVVAVSVFFINNSAFAFGGKATDAEVSAAHAAWDSAQKAVDDADLALQEANFKLLESPTAENRVSVAKAEKALKEAQKARDKAQTEYYSLRQDITGFGNALCAFCLATLGYALFLAAGHFIGSFVDPMIGLVFSGVVVVFGLYCITSNTVDGLYVKATVGVLALALAGYVHFTKTMAIA